MSIRNFTEPKHTAKEYLDAFVQYARDNISQRRLDSLHEQKGMFGSFYDTDMSELENMLIQNLWEEMDGEASYNNAFYLVRG